MDAIYAIVQAVLALDQTLAHFASAYGAWIYALLFAIIFAETGLIVTPFLPGDSLLFVAGTVVATSGGNLDIHTMVALLILAAILGDNTNYAVGKWIGPKIFQRQSGFMSRFIRKDYLLRTQAFYDRYGPVTVLIGRFIPIIRTFAPFLAGVAGMHYPRFLAYEVLGSILWIGSLCYAGYLFGNIPWVKSNLTLIVVGIVVVSLIPAIVTFAKERGAPASDAAGELGRKADVTRRREIP